MYLWRILNTAADIDSDTDKQLHHIHTDRSLKNFKQNLEEKCTIFRHLVFIVSSTAASHSI